MIRSAEAGHSPHRQTDDQTSDEKERQAMGGMAEMKNTVALKPAADPKVAAEGTYAGPGRIMMAGKWNVTVSVKVGDKLVAETKLTVTAK